MTHTSNWPWGRKRKHTRLRPSTHKLPSNPRRRGHGIGQGGRATGTRDGDAHNPTALPRRTRPYHDGALAAEGFPATEIKQQQTR